MRSSDEDGIKSINRVEVDKRNKDQIETDFLKIKEMLNKGNGKHHKPYIQRMLHEKENLRKVYLALVKSNPAKIAEIFEISLLTKPTCYKQLHDLLSLKLVNRIFIADIKDGKIIHPEIENKFENWVKSMPDNLKRYYRAKTSYWEVSEFGKQFAVKAFEFDQEFREHENKKEKEMNDER